MCCRGRDNDTNQGFGGKKESRNKKQTRRRQVLAGFVDHTRKRTRRPSGYQPGISIKRRVEYSNPKCSQFCACGSSSLLLSVHVCSSSWCLRSSFAMSVAKYMTKAPGHVSPTQCAEFLRHKGNQTQWAQLNPPSGKVAAKAASFAAQKKLALDHKTTT